MPSIGYREIQQKDIPAVAAIRAAGWGTAEYWVNRITAYLTAASNPQEALETRIILVACDRNDEIIGFIAGHLTHRFDCDGELQWINVLPEYQRKGIATQLLLRLAKWFVGHQAFKVCVNVNADSPGAEEFYKRHQAETMNKYWMIWPDICILTDTER